jgi:hypothetical protein
MSQSTELHEAVQPDVTVRFNATALAEDIAGLKSTYDTVIARLECLSRANLSTHEDLKDFARILKQQGRNEVHLRT